MRFAPSPTGELHPGGARTALFNWLFARHGGGRLVLRIEDTDRARSEERFVESILEDLAWLGLSFDEGPYRQSERGGLYEGSAQRLREAGLVYASADEAGREALYFRPPARQGAFRDALRGEVPFSRVGDFVVVKSDGTPSYNFAAVVDDSGMGITHVIRGEEHLSNTARQALLYRALGLREPEFLHLGLILGPDGKKLSKRHGAESIRSYREGGYLPEALVNHLALLGWSHPEGKEEFASLDELAEDWDPSRLGASPSVFDPERLLGLNARRIRALPLEELLEKVRPFLSDPLPEGRELVAVEVMREEMRTLSDAPRVLRGITATPDPAAVAEALHEGSGAVLAHVAEEIRGREFGDVEEARGFVKELRSWAKAEGIGTRDLLHPLRLALAGRDRGPEMAYLFAVLGAGKARERIEGARRAKLGS